MSTGGPTSASIPLLLIFQREQGKHNLFSVVSLAKSNIFSDFPSNSDTF